MKATEQYFPVVLFVMLHRDSQNGSVAFESAKEILNNNWPFIQMKATQ